MFAGATSAQPSGGCGKSRSRLPDGTSKRQISCHFLPVAIADNRCQVPLGKRDLLYGESC